jgi:O-antigen ligase
VASVAIALMGRMTSQRFMRLAAVGLLALPILMVSGIVDDAIEDFDRRPDNVASRNSLAADGIDAFVESGGLGIGLGTFKETQPNVIHNTALWLLVEMSIVGLAFFIAMSVIPVPAAAAAMLIDRNVAFGLLGAHLTMVVASVSIEALYQRQWWLCIGLTSLAYGPAGKRSTGDSPEREPVGTSS